MILSSLFQKLKSWNPWKKDVVKEELCVLSLSYRHANSEGPVSPKLTKILIEKAKEWKIAQPYLKNKEVDEEEFTYLEKASRYPSFFQKLLQSHTWTKHFYDWSLRDKNKVEVFLLFPETAELLLKSNLSQRLGPSRDYLLNISHESPKDLTLLFEGRQVSLLNLDEEVEFKFGYRLTLRQIFKIFEEKALSLGNLEVMNEGIVNWSPINLGPWNPRDNKWESISLSDKNWIKELPVFESLTSEQLRVRYQKDFEPGQWIISSRTTRDNLNLDFMGTHAFIEIAIPQEEGHYNVYNFGKFAKEFPKNSFETFKILCRLSKASIAYPDDSVFYTFREQAATSFVISEMQGEAFLDSIKEDMLTAFHDNMIYQVESENCAKWVNEKLEHTLGKFHVPPLFWIPLLDTEGSGVMGFIFRLIKRLPVKFRLPVMSFFHFPAGAFQVTFIEEGGQRVMKALYLNEFFDHGHVFLPALMNHRQEEEKWLQEVDRLRSFYDKGLEWVQKMVDRIEVKALKILQTFLTPYLINGPPLKPDAMRTCLN